MDRGSAYHCRLPLGSDQSAVHRLSPQTLPGPPVATPPSLFLLKLSCSISSFVCILFCFGKGFWESGEEPVDCAGVF